MQAATTLTNRPPPTAGTRIRYATFRRPSPPRRRKSGPSSRVRLDRGLPIGGTHCCSKPKETISSRKSRASNRSAPRAPIFTSRSPASNSAPSAPQAKKSALIISACGNYSSIRARRQALGGGRSSGPVIPSNTWAPKGPPIDGARRRRVRDCHTFVDTRLSCRELTRFVRIDFDRITAGQIASKSAHQSNDF